MAASDSSIIRPIARGAFYGLVAWMIYAVLEFVLATTAPLRTYGNTVLASWYWSLTFTLWAVYAAAGLLLGGIGGYLMALFVPAVRTDALWSRRLLETAGVTTLAVAMTANLATAAAFDFAALLCGALIVAGLLAAIVSKRWMSRTGLLRNPWASATLLLLLPRIADSLSHRAVWLRALAPVGLLAAVLLGSVLSRALRLQDATGRSDLFKAGAVVAAIAVVLGYTAYINPGLAPLHATAAPPGHRKQTSVVLITLDTVRRDHLSVYGYQRNTTPNLARLAAESTLYRNAVAAADMTLPTHAAIFTGMYGSWSGARFNAPEQVEPQPLSKRYATLAEMLAQKGYLTMSVAANVAYFQPHFGFNRGFAVFDAPSPLRFLSYDRTYYLRFGVRTLLNRFVPTADFDLATRRASEVNVAIAQGLRRDWDGQRPLFLFANYMDAHSPYVPPGPFHRMFPANGLHLTTNEYYQLADQVVSLKRPITPSEREHLLSRYDGSIAYLDSELGKLMASLKEKGIYDDSLIIVTADHGEVFGEKNLVGHGLSVYQNQIGIPLIVKYPRQRSARTIDYPVSQVDLLPTVLDVLGSQAPGHLQGRSLLRADDRPAPDLYSESFAQAKLIATHPRFNRVERALVSGNMKLVSSTAGKRELYDISKDPEERQDLCGSAAETCATLQRKLEQWCALIPRFRSPTEKLTKDNLDRLRSLGYVQ